ncbi:Heterogeneous nuclear ribonucleoprotein like [Actinidia chinensis var. chinensis]|uniref:Heterogeneous nuclear ribonucleoprotein like n=1 Tax=Actinidia chinensis var. chinensis TaxID=1590841 RepID=A0A2R6RCI9_ACTCC|nr:Heterogeneous nuclear ribonucleoprotein like [Actinidia chinensis var. chinensis]
MDEGAEIDDRVDLDDDNYEEMEDDVEEQMEDEGAGRGGDRYAEDQHEDLRSEEDSEKERSPEVDVGEVDIDEVDKSIITNEPVEDEENPSASIDEDEKDKRAELLALPPHGSEVFIGGLPRDVSEEDLRDLCEALGEIFEIRMVKNRDTGDSKGFAFVSFKTKEIAQQAIEELHNKDFKGRTLRCSLAEAKRRLFIGNVPKSWTDEEFNKVIEETGPGAENIELIKDPQNPSRNRGFAFIEYYNNACADYSRQKMSSATFKLEGNTPTVSWADPKSTPDHSAAASQVKALYVKNIPENTPTEQVKQLFQRHGEVTKVVMPPAKSGGKRDFGFIHYAERSSALKAVKDAEKYEIDGQVLEVCLAKPQSDKKFDGANPHSSGPHPNYIPHPGYGGFPGNPYGPLGAGYGGVASNFQQPMIYGRGPMPAGMHMVPMVLPDGQIGYVLQQPGVQMPLPRPRRNDRSNGSGGRGGASGGSDDANRSRRYRPY